MAKTLFMETTEIDPLKTAGEITSLLVQTGATSIMQEYKNGNIVALSFQMAVAAGTIAYTLPVRIEPVYKQLVQRHPSWDVSRCRLQAKRVAWRQLLRWVQAQLAMIDTGMVVADEVFMPYAKISDTETIYERIKAENYRALLPQLNGPMRPMLESKP